MDAPAIRPRTDILVENGRIAALGRDLPSGNAMVVDAAGMIAMPGFVDGHRHLWEALIRARLPTQDLAGYIALVNGRLGAAFDAQDAYLGTLLGALGALDSGVTTVLDWSHIQSSPAHTSSTLAAYDAAGIGAVFGYGKGPRADPLQAWPGDIQRIARALARRPGTLVTPALATASPEFVAADIAREHFALARRSGAMVTVHSGLRGLGRPGAIAAFARAGLLGPDVNLVHCATLSAEEWRWIARTGTTVTITPAVEMQMGHGDPPMQAARDAGVVPSLGVDVETSAPADLWTQMRIAYAQQRASAFNRLGGGAGPSLMTPRDMLACATLAGARATRLEDRIGRLRVGMEADIILLRTDLPHVIPVTDAESSIVLSMDARNVDTVLVAGRIVKRAGVLVGVDLGRLRAAAAARSEALWSRAGAATG